MKRFLATLLISAQIFASSASTSGSGGGTGILTLNTLTADPQLFATGTSGTDFAISSASDTHTFNLPDASATARGVVTTGSQTLAGVKTLSSAPVCSALTASKIVLTSGGKALASSSYGESDLALTSTDQTIAGIKTLSSAPIMSALTASKPVCTDGSKALTSTCTAKLVWGDVATGNNYRLIATGGAGVTAEAAAITASRALVSDANGIPTHATTTSTEIGYVNGVTSAIQTQINTKLTSTGFVEEWVGHIVTAANTTYYVIPYSQVARQVTSIRIACGTSGTITAALKIGGTNITTCNGISVTSTPGTTTCDTGSTNDLGANGQLTLVTTSNSSCLDLYYDIKTTRD